MDEEMDAEWLSSFQHMTNETFSPEDKNSIENFVCDMYGMKQCRSTNVARTTKNQQQMKPNSKSPGNIIKELTVACCLRARKSYFKRSGDLSILQECGVTPTNQIHARDWIRANLDGAQLGCLLCLNGMKVQH